MIDVSAAEFHDFAELSQHLVDSDLGAVLALQDGSTLMLTGVDKDSLTADHFHFSS